MNNLTANQVYYVRAWTENEAGISYSEEVSFQTSNYQNIRFGAQINGGGYALNHNVIFIVNDENIFFHASLSENDTSKSISLILPLEQPNEGTYLFGGFNSSSEDIPSLSSVYYSNTNNSENITHYDITNGTMTITREIDMYGQSYTKGTFSFTATIEQKVVEITNGLFKIYY